MSPREQSLEILLEQAKSDLSIHEKKFQTLIEKNSDMIALRSPEGKVSYISPAFTRGLGYTLEDMHKFAPMELIHPDDKDGLQKSMLQVLAAPGNSCFCQQRVRHKNGNWVWCEGTMTNFIEEPGINAIAINFRDVTEQKRTMEAFEKGEKKFREFFEMAPEGIAILNPATATFTKFNANALRLLKFSFQDIFGKTPAEISPEFQPDGSISSEKAADYISQAMRGEKPVFEWLIKNGGGELVLFEVRLIALTATGTPSVYASFVDITERKNAEMRVLAQNHKLSEIASLQSHQVRKPIASILGLISLINFNDPADPMNMEVMLKIKTASLMFDEIIKAIVVRTSEIEKLNNDRPENNNVFLI